MLSVIFLNCHRVLGEIKFKPRILKDVAVMRRILIALLILLLCPLPARAAEEKLVALTFDDGPSGKYTRVLLDGLEQRGVRATFFLCGYRIEEYPELTRRICKEGHEIGLHGYSHKSMHKMSRKEIEQELHRSLQLLPEGCSITFLRPPGGKCSKQVITAAESLGLAVLDWSVDPKDWATDDVQAIEANVLCHVRDGDVILLHDMSYSSVEAALYIVDTLQSQGFRFVTASQLAEAKGIVPLPGKVYTRFLQQAIAQK